MDTKFFDDIIETKAAFEKHIRSVGEEKFSMLFTEFFNEVPEVSMVMWEQFTPAFNDGDPCEFRIHELNFYNKEEYSEEEFEELDGSGDVLLCGECNNASIYSQYIVLHEEASNVCEKLIHIISSDEDIMKLIFGDPAKIIVKRSGELIVEEYEVPY